ncbi:hypothetical protein ESB00_01860 [Oleiharenicola lentus]|jgi:hypothetical protein|uniref:Uncharacterized protein n=1 Tax=Oleiharenicola lentus TaxID=2508720 RepID=A0A4Q1C787_9BACT|nr:DUF5989 family protein [Oleiharenicola lentus]RXK54666.1 hypothetical protein ESB00_01860 [Oleiharenicola lentus]
MSDKPKTKFTDVKPAREKGVLGEFWGLLMSNKKYWMLPIILLLLVFGVLVILSGSSAAPFIYTLF